MGVGWRPLRCHLRDGAQRTPSHPPLLCPPHLVLVDHFQSDLLLFLSSFFPLVKNTTNILAKTSPYVLTPELFALHLATHLVTKYPHIHKAFVDIDSLRWSRIEVSPAIYLYLMLVLQEVQAGCDKRRAGES